jgi:hypothetical protein
MKRSVVILLIISALFTMAPKKPKPPLGITGYEIVSEQHAVGGTEDYTVQVNCPEGKVALGGGRSGTTGYYILESYPAPLGTGWIITVGSDSTVLTFYAVCADVAQ